MDDLTPQPAPDIEPERDNAPALAELYTRAEAGAFAHQFADLRLAEIETRRVGADGQPTVARKKLNPRQAWFVAWFGANERIREPKTLAEVAKFLNVSRQTLYQWQAADWFTLTGVKRWEQGFLTAHIPALYRKLMENALLGEGNVSNAAIKLGLEAWQRSLEPPQAATATAAVQVNVNGTTVQIVDQAKERFAQRLAELAERAE